VNGIRGTAQTKGRKKYEASEVDEDFGGKESMYFTSRQEQPTVNKKR
jgi:hypothetical protein